MLLKQFRARTEPSSLWSAVMWRKATDQKGATMTPEEIARQWFDGFANRDVDKLRSLYHDDCFVEAHGGRIVGRYNVESRFTQLFEDEPPFRSIELVNVFEIGNVAVLEFTYFEELSPDDPLPRLNVCVVLEVRDQRIAKERYYDKGPYPIDREELADVRLPVSHVTYAREPWEYR